MAGRSTGSKARTTSSSKKAKTTSRSRSTRGGSGRGTSVASKNASPSRSADGLTAAERKYLARPFDKDILRRAEQTAKAYRLVIEEDQDEGYFGSTIELPLVMGGGKTISACAKNVLEATTAAVATILEAGDTPPSPAREGKRDQQVNIRLTAEEKLRLEEAARRDGFRGLSDYLRSAAIERAG